MGLYLCVFDGDEELEGVEIGSYADFGLFRETVKAKLEGGLPGSRFPMLMEHSDCDGEWSPREASALLAEILVIADELSRLPPIAIEGGWKQAVERSLGLTPRHLGDCFFDVDGEPLLDRMRELCECSIQRELPILFQ